MKLGTHRALDPWCASLCLRVREECVMFLSWPVGNSLEACLNNEVNVQSTVSAPLLLCNYLCCGRLIICTCVCVCVRSQAVSAVRSAVNLYSYFQDWNNKIRLCPEFVGLLISTKSHFARPTLIPLQRPSWPQIVPRSPTFCWLFCGLVFVIMVNHEAISFICLCHSFSTPPHFLSHSICPTVGLLCSCISLFLLTWESTVRNSRRVKNSPFLHNSYFLIVRSFSNIELAKSEFLFWLRFLALSRVHLSSDSQKKGKPLFQNVSTYKMGFIFMLSSRAFFF